MKFSGRVLKATMAVGCLGLCAVPDAFAQQLRLLGIDVSTYQGNISTANWATLKRATNQQVGGVYGDGRDFVFIRSSRGGTTGEDHRQGGYPSGNNTFYSYSERYDDPYYVQNINRATAAGLFAGTYHFARADILASTLNSDGVTTAGVDNSGTDEADHIIQMAGPWMRPGFLLPVLDMEAGQSQRTSAALTQFCIDFSDRIYAVMGIRPMIYINGSYASYMQSSIVPAIPNLWSARWPNQADPNSIDVQNGNPKDSYAPIYGPWDDPPYPANPWKFWQYASTAHVNAIGNGASNCDVDVAQGGMEFLKDMLVPAIWVTNADGQWTTLTNWNSGLTPQAPVPGPGQLTPIGTQTLPTPALPGTNDTVILDRPSVAVTVTLSSGAQNIRKLFMRETLNITGGSLTINYVPSWDSTNFSAQFSGPVTLGAGAGLTAHTILVDAAKTFTVNGGSLAFSTLNLVPGATPAKLAMGGDATFNAVTNGIATITNGTGSGTSGSIDLTAGTRAFNVGGSAELFVTVPVSNGGLFKGGFGTLRLSGASTYASGTIVSRGKLLVNNTTGSGTGTGVVTVTNGILGGTGTISGAVTIDLAGTLAPGPGTSFGALTLNMAPVLNGTNFVKIDRNGGSPLADKLVLTSGVLTYGGTLVVSNAGAALTGGEAFTNFVAPARAGAFAASIMPALDSGLNWYLGDLVPFGRIKVNRSPVAGAVVATNVPGGQVQIPLASLTSNATDADGDAITLAGIAQTSTNGAPISTNGGFIAYSSSVNVADAISFTITDGHGGTATGAVLIVPSSTGQFLGQVSVTNDSATLRFAGGPGMTYYVERSTALPAWQTISTNVMPANGVLDFTDDFHDLAGPPSGALYRLRWSQ